MKGELHEAFNLGLDPSLDEHTSDTKTIPRTNGELAHSENLWPSIQDWDDAQLFVSRPTIIWNY